MDSSVLSPDPRIYVRIMRHLRTRLADGTLQPGSPAPTIGALCELFGCTRQTSAKALNLLAQAGQLVLYPGLGYYVAMPRDVAHCE